MRETGGTFTVRRSGAQSETTRMICEYSDMISSFEVCIFISFRRRCGER
jgi:hypothetical protein